MLLERLNLGNADSRANPAIINHRGEMLTYSDLYSSAISARSFFETSGITSATRVATILPNGTLNAIAVLSAMDTAICCPLSPTLNSYEYNDQLQALAADVIICTDDYVSRLLPVCQSLHISLYTVEFRPNTFQLTFSAANKVRTEVPSASGGPNDYCLILLTSGSTGYPKRVGLSLDNILHSALEVASTLDLAPADVCLSMWEQYHIGGIVDLLLAPLISRSAIRMTPGYSSQIFQAVSSTQSFSWLQCVPTTLLDMINTIRSNDISLPSELRLIRSVASHLSPQLHDVAEQVFGVPIIQTYGMTEASPLITSNLLDPKSRRKGSVGVRLSTEVVILGEDDQILSSGSTGEVSIRGKNVISSYDDPTGETSACFTDGWFRTGDLGYFDSDGFLWLVGRQKQQVNRGGEKISLRQIEDCTLELAYVLDVHALAMPHPTLGQVPGLLVCLDPHHRTQSFKAGLESHLNKRLSKYKRPAKIWYLDAIPRSSTGKIKHQDVRLILESLATADHASLNNSKPRSRSSLQDKIASIWSEELNTEDFSYDEDFVNLGGDSLSAVRVISKAEEQFFVRYPEACWEGMNTVTRMAEITEALIRESLAANNRGDNSVSPSGDKHYARTPLADPKSDLELAISTGYLGDVFVDELCSDELTEYILDPSLSPATAQAALERKRNLWTPSELLQFHDDFSSFTSLQSRPSSGFIERYLVSITQAYQGKSSALAWTPTCIQDGVRLYTRPQSSGKSLIIGFGGFFSRMMMPMDGWLQALSHLDYDFLFLWDKTRRFYNKGILGYAEDPRDLSIRLQDTAASLGYTNIVGIGVSMGGFPCAAIASAQSWDRAIIFSPDRQSKHLPYHSLFLHENRVSMAVLAGSLHAYDVDSARQLARECGASLHLIRDCKDHNTIWYLKRKGLLASALSRMINAPTL